MPSEFACLCFALQGHVTAEDEAALAKRKAKAAVEREAARERRAELDLDDESSRASSPGGTPQKKKKFIHAPRVDEQHAAAAAAAFTRTASDVGDAPDAGEDVAAGSVDLASDPDFAAFVSDPVAAHVTAVKAAHGHGHSGGGGRPVCKYEPGCYRHNADHLAQFAHPERERREKEEADANAKEAKEAAKEAAAAAASPSEAVKAEAAEEE